MTEFKYQKIVFLSNSFPGGAGSKTFSKNIQMSFTPKRMNVKSIMYSNGGGAEDFTRLIYMDRIGIIGVFNDLIPSSSNIGFNLGNINWTDGNYDFKILKSDNGELETEAIGGRLVICLEFLG